MVQGPYSCIQRYLNHCNSPSSLLLHGTPVPGTGINSQTSSTPEVGAIINPISQMRKLRVREMKSLVQDTQLLNSRVGISIYLVLPCSPSS